MKNIFTIQVTENHNGKFNNGSFPIIRPYKPYYREGVAFDFVYRNVCFKQADLCTINVFPLRKLNDSMALLDFNCTAAELKEVIKVMFRHAYEVEGDNMKLCFMVFKTTKTFQALPTNTKARKMQELPLRADIRRQLDRIKKVDAARSKVGESR